MALQGTDLFVVQRQSGGTPLLKTTAAEINTYISKDLQGVLMVGNVATLGATFGGELNIQSASNTTISFLADGSGSFTGKVTSASTEATDGGTTLVTKDYLTGGGSGGIGTLGYWDRTGTDLSPVNSGDNLKNVGSGEFSSTVRAGNSANSDIALRGVNNSSTNSAVSGYNYAPAGPCLNAVDGAGNVNATIKADGSGTFAGSIISGGFDLANTSSSGVRILASGAVQIQRDVGANNSSRFEIIRGTNDKTVELYSDGSANFAKQQFRVASSGETIIDSPATAAGSNLFSCKSALNSGNEVAAIKADGSGVFAGALEAASIDGGTY